MARVASFSGEGITVATITGQAETGNAAGLDESDAIEVTDSVDQHYKPAKGANFTRNDGGAKRAGFQVRGLPASLSVNSLSANGSSK